MHVLCMYKYVFNSKFWQTKILSIKILYAIAREQKDILKTQPK